MILGIGNDLIDIRRIEAVLVQHGARFEKRLFTKVEQDRAAVKPVLAYVYAKRFAAKEAMAKALGAGLKKGVFFKDMGVVNLPTGQPHFVLTGGAAKQLDLMVPAGMKPMVHLSMTDDYPYALAFVVIEAV